MAITMIEGQNVIRPDGTEAKKAVLLSDSTPSSLEITGADVQGLNNDDVIAVGSTLITPDANYIAFADGVFTRKSGSDSSDSRGGVEHDDAYYEALAKQALTGKVMICLGDSYTVGMSSQLSAIATKYGMKIDNRGVVSATISWRSSDSNRRMYNKADTIVSDYTGGVTLDGATYHASDVAVITFMGGANDGSATDAWIGTGPHETDKSTICGSLNHIFSSLLETFTNAKIICITQPSFYSLTVSDVTTDAEAQELGFDDLAELQVFSDTQYSNYCMAMKESAVKTMAWCYGIPVVDMFNEFPSVFNAENRSAYWQSDKLHLTASGYSLIANALDKKIVSLFI